MKDKIIGSYGRGKAMMEASDLLTDRYGHKPTTLRFVKAIVELLEEDRKNTSGVYVSDWSSLFDLAQQGASGGFSGLCYYGETHAIYEQHSDAIWSIAASYTDDNGGEPAAILGKGANTAATFENSAVWFAAEAVAHAVTQCGEEYFLWETDGVAKVMV